MIWKEQEMWVGGHASFRRCAIKNLDFLSSTLNWASITCALKLWSNYCKIITSNIGYINMQKIHDRWSTIQSSSSTTELHSLSPCIISFNCHAPHFSTTKTNFAYRWLIEVASKHKSIFSHNYTSSVDCDGERDGLMVCIDILLLESAAHHDVNVERCSRLDNLG